MEIFGIRLWGSKDNLEVSFGNIKKDMENIRRWLNYLHEKTENIHSQAHSIAMDHHKHKTDLYEYTNSVNNWIDYLHKKHTKLEEDIEKIESNIKSMIRHDLDRYHKEIIGHLKEGLYTNHRIIKQEILEEVEKLIEKDEVEYEPVLKEFKVPDEELTGPEQELIQVMFNENTPMTYEDLARKTGKSINSIRVYMNSAKSKSDIIEEFKKPSGEKIFSIKNKEKVKTLFNLHY